MNLMQQQSFEKPAKCFERRRAGALLHVTSLPGPGSCGDLGPEARRFVEFLAGSGFSVWQMLPVGPTGSDGSPYQTTSVHAGNPRLISLAGVRKHGWLAEDTLDEAHASDAGKRVALSRSWNVFLDRASDEDREALAAFVDENSYWLDDYALFAALRMEAGKGWWEWPQTLRDRDPEALAQARARLADAIDHMKYEQFLFFRQWLDLKAYANARGILLFGDMPIFVAHDSAEVWARPEDFDLTPDAEPRVVAGVPPDYFSETGQRWGNPLYRWKQMRADGFAFWIDRMRTQLKLFDMVRIDHFRGFESYWEIPSEEEYAINGSWVRADGDALFNRLHEVFGPLPLVAEDLGIITPEVDRLRKRHGLPGMKVLQFAFSGDANNPYLPFRHSRDSVVYTGTHDNDTTLGWYLSLDDGTRQYVDEYLGRSKEPMPWPLVRAALGSRSALAILPMQDILGLDGHHRMNLPGTTEGNWTWRFSWDLVEHDLVERLRRRIRMYGRLP
jgi:4-alpha-glucanotransferase